MFDWIFANSFIDHKVSGRLYLSEYYSTLSDKMKDSNSTITVHVMDFLGFEDVKTFNKKDITYYGSN